MERVRNDPIRFLFALQDWEGFDPALFDRTVQDISVNILDTARELEWLSNPYYEKLPADNKTKSIGKFVRLLTEELTSVQWLLLADTFSEEGPKSLLKRCLGNDLISPDLKDFKEMLEIIERSDLAAKLDSYSPIFKDLSKNMLHEQILDEIDPNRQESIAIMQFHLRKYIKAHNKDVSAVLGEASVPIESVYTPLTVIKVKPALERMKEESDINEIDFLLKMHKQVQLQSVEVVDFEEIITTFDSCEGKILCLIGNPGSGKSFLCQNFAFLYGVQRLNNFDYVISIPCRSQEWHQLEEARQEKKNTIDGEFIISWLSLSMSLGTRWSKFLSTHLLESDGKGLFIIIDGIDEFTMSVPFESTLLCKILERRFLTLSTMLVTSRPSPWTELLLSYGTQFRIDENFQVLGFTPENRDIYFKKRIVSSEKLNAVREMFHRHNEIQQLSLVPVNASLFTALFNQSDSILSHTLSDIYSQLIVYLIRRQLSRMDLKEYIDVFNMSDFHPGIRKCILKIGREANQGIFDRDLTSDKNIPLKIEDKFYPGERLGLMQSHIKVVSFGVRVKVWTFQHLTIQEFMAALSICNNSWTNQCFIIRYFTASTKYLSRYKMVIRFLCGILQQNAGCITPILMRHALPRPIQLHGLPMVKQLYYSTSLVEISDWIEFSKTFLFICSVINETNTTSIQEHFSYFQDKFQDPLYLYFVMTISPNEWHCFLQSLQHIRKIQILHLHSDFVTSIQFHSLLGRLASSCSIIYLALLFIDSNFKTIYSYTRKITSSSLPIGTKISINLDSCDLTDCTLSSQLFSSMKNIAGSLMLSEVNIRRPVLTNLIKRFSSIDFFYFRPISSSANWPTLEELIKKRQIRGLYLDDPEGYSSFKPSTLSAFRSLKEVCWITKQDCYQVLTYIQGAKDLKYLYLSSSKQSNGYNRNLLSQLNTKYGKSMRDITLLNLHKVGFDSWGNITNMLKSFSNLVSLNLFFTEISSADIHCWKEVISNMNSLVQLALVSIPVQDSGMRVLCRCLCFHPAIRSLLFEHCELTSASCTTFINLIQTLRNIKIIECSREELSRPETERLQLLIEVSEECSVKIELSDD